MHWYFKCTSELETNKAKAKHCCCPLFHFPTSKKFIFPKPISEMLRNCCLWLHGLKILQHSSPQKIQQKTPPKVNDKMTEETINTAPIIFSWFHRFPLWKIKKMFTEVIQIIDFPKPHLRLFSIPFILEMGKRKQRDLIFSYNRSLLMMFNRKSGLKERVNSILAYFKVLTLVDQIVQSC